ncbi:hypothetical protein EPD60_08390 [Flaviaesturariibacter flavus]|uniref:Glutaminyl-tRNA synthetase n=1 Tax=Flaviaesturariibacter flavus TaxID=2502780 RepID=A0A4R1BAP6_9BACT|nr:DUF6370 family protein [Flaviaesturariibacter flavus]TCJ14023.1 hypothetical protein EPD60_08390 [Flaviaesturariibacter flavus]
MKQLLLIFSLALAGTASAQQKVAPDSLRTVEAACGQCRFGLPGKGCDLAVRFGGKAYFVDGTSIDKHGDAHAADGFCKAVRQARVKGSVVDGRFKATHFEVLPAVKKS